MVLCRKDPEGIPGKFCLWAAKAEDGEVRHGKGSSGMLNSLRPTKRCKTPVYTVDISADGSRYLWGGGSPGEDCTLSVSDVVSNNVLFTLSAHRKPVMRARFLHDGSIVSFSFDSHVCKWTSTGKLAASNQQHLAHRADGCAIPRGGKIIVTGDYLGRIFGWRPVDGSQSFNFMENDRGLQIWALASNTRGDRLISGGAGGKIRLWRLPGPEQQSEIELGWGYHVTGLAWHPDETCFLAASAPDGAASEGSKSRVTIYNASSCREVISFSPDGHQPLCCGFSPDGGLVAAAGGATDRGDSESKTNCVIHLWDTGSGKHVAKLTGHTGLVRDLAFTPDSRWLLSAGWDCTVRSWCLSDADSPAVA